MGLGWFKPTHGKADGLFANRMICMPGSNRIFKHQGVLIPFQSMAGIPSHPLGVLLISLQLIVSQISFVLMIGLQGI